MLLKVIESNLHRIAVNENYPTKVFDVVIKDTDAYISVYKEEVGDLISMLRKALELL